MLQSKASLNYELGSLNFKHLIELEHDVIEGIYHTGMGAVVQAMATKEMKKHQTSRFWYTLIDIRELTMERNAPLRYSVIAQTLHWLTAKVMQFVLYFFFLLCHCMARRCACGRGSLSLLRAQRWCAKVNVPTLGYERSELNS
ncbi:hypothetical protein SAMN05421760_10772 [Neptunomonas antarctica]|uniref:Uncharacterized protein n=1 Tax=Neptunomonas antarctica TaxID=619304 RepID=A0A1N7MW82_9GAMM|nr:hypothetical protein SAMN05421760_10772 [Neptunomonas antarctica]